MTMEIGKEENLAYEHCRKLSHVVFFDKKLQSVLTNIEELNNAIEATKKKYPEKAFEKSDLKVSRTSLLYTDFKYLYPWTKASILAQKGSLFDLLKADKGIDFAQCSSIEVKTPSNQEIFAYVRDINESYLREEPDFNVSRASLLESLGCRNLLEIKKVALVNKLVEDIANLCRSEDDTVNDELADKQGDRSLAILTALQKSKIELLGAKGDPEGGKKALSDVYPTNLHHELYGAISKSKTSERIYKMGEQLKDRSKTLGMDDFKQVVDFLLNDAALKEFAQNVRLQNGNDSKAIDLASLKKKLKDFKARLDKNEKLPETKKDDIPECFIKSFKDSYNQAIIAMEIILLATGCDESKLQKYKNNVFSGNESLDSTAEEDDDDKGSENPYLIKASIGLSDTPENIVIDLQDAAPVSEETALTKFEENKLDNANTSLDNEEQQRLSDLFGKAVFPKIITELKSLALYMEEALAKAKTQTDKYQAKEKQYLTSYCVKCFLEWLYINKNKGFNVDYIIKNLLKRISEEPDKEQFAYLLNKEYLIGAANYYNTKTGDEIVPGASPRKFDDWARNGMNYSKAYTEETHKELMVFGITRFRAL